MLIQSTHRNKSLNKTERKAATESPRPEQTALPDSEQSSDTNDVNFKRAGLFALGGAIAAGTAIAFGNPAIQWATIGLASFAVGSTAVALTLPPNANKVQTMMGAAIACTTAGVVGLAAMSGGTGTQVALACAGGGVTGLLLGASTS